MMNIDILKFIVTINLFVRMREVSFLSGTAWRWLGWL